MSDEKLISLYNEAATAVRHYSNCIKHMRTIVLVQGLVILTAVLYSLTLTEDKYFYYTIYFGILFTLVLSRQQANYLSDITDHLSTTAAIEPLLHNDSKLHTWSKYYEKHNELRTGWIARVLYFKLIVEYGPFTLFIATFILLLILKEIDHLPIILNKCS
jgi:hypothetical protein